MAVILKQVMPEGVSLEMLDAVTDAMGVDADPPKGLIVHSHYEDGGRIHINDVWDSEADYQSFASERLSPAMTKVAEQHGMAPPAGEMETAMLKVHRVVRGR